MFAKLIPAVALFAVAAQAFPTIIPPLFGSPSSPAPSGNDDFEPKITSPTASQTWTVGQLVNVTWDTSDIPQGQENKTGMLLLGFDENNSENLDIKTPLANNFLLEAGFVTLTVPNVTARNDYIVVLFGDSGNASPEFTIQP